MTLILEFVNEIKTKIINNKGRLSISEKNEEIIDSFLIDLENAFYALHEAKDCNTYISALDELLKLINNNKIIRQEDYKYICISIKNIKIAIDSKKNEDIKKFSEALFKNIYIIVTNLKQKRKEEEKRIITLKEIITRLNNIIENINEEGEFKYPPDEMLIDIITNQMIHHTNLDTIELLHEITIKQQNAINREKAKKTAKLIQERRKKTKKQTKQIEQPTTPQMNDEQQQVYNEAKKIIEKELENIQEPDELEILFIKELYNENLTIEQLNSTIKDANSNECSLKFIIYGMQFQINNLNNANMQDNINLIKEYINLYKKYIKKINDEKQIIDNLNNELKKLEEQIKSIILEFEDYKEETIEKLTNTQKQLLLSFYEIELTTDEKTKKEIDETLKKANLNIEFLLFYNSYKTIEILINQLKTRSIDKTNEEDLKNTINLIKQIIKASEILIKAKEEYINQSNENEHENKSENQEENIILYLQDENGKTYGETRINGDTTINNTDHNALEYLEKMIKTYNSTQISMKSAPVLPKSDDYKKRRIKQGKMRIVFIILAKEIIKSDKDVYLIITAGKKNSDSHEIYEETNYLKSKVLNFIEKYKELQNASQEEIMEFIKKYNSLYTQREEEKKHETKK